jgi:hypothetical protein
MKNIRKISTNPISLFTLCIAFLFFSCQEPAVNRSAYTGDELFKGIFFAQGSVVAHLPSLNSLIKVTDLVDINDPIYNILKP